MTTDERMRAGREQLKRLNPQAEADLHEALDAIAPDLPGLVVAYGYGDIYARPGLAIADRQVATIAALAALEATSRGAGQTVLDSLHDIAPDMAAFILDFSYGDVISRPALAPRRKELVMLAAAIARGTMRPQLKVHAKAGLNVGLTQTEIAEVAIQMAGYAGFPAAINGLIALREAFAEVDAGAAEPG